MFVLERTNALSKGGAVDLLREVLGMALCFEPSHCYVENAIMQVSLEELHDGFWGIMEEVEVAVTLSFWWICEGDVEVDSDSGL